MCGLFLLWLLMLNPTLKLLTERFESEGQILESIVVSVSLLMSSGEARLPSR